MTEGTEDGTDPIDALAEDFLVRHRRGERPKAEDYAARHPGLASQIHELFPALLVMENLSPSRDTAPAPPGGEAGVLGDFRIVREVGRGGMGVVYEAVQQSLGRRVALKVLPPALAASETARERFAREARAAARLHHTNIVPVFAVGEEGGTPYYAMQFIDGRPLDALLRQLRGGGDREPAAAGVLTVSVAAGVSPTPTPTASPASGESSTGGASPAPGPVGHFREVARLGLQAAEALAYAHGQGVLHRDVKPANLLVDRQGDLWVTDFGLAQAGDGEALTGTGDIVGTLRYLAPERFRGQCDARSEVYSLGVTLYELATLRPAFAEADRPRLVEQIARHALTPPRRLAPAMPADLETVVLKACAAEPAERYATAEDLAEDLRRFLDDRPIRARRSTVLQRLRRWRRRNPVVAALTSTVVVLTALLAAGSTVAVLWLSAALRQADRAGDDLREQLWRARVDQARANRRARGVGQRVRSLRLLEEAARTRVTPELRDEVIACLALADLEEIPGTGGDLPPSPQGLAVDLAHWRYAVVGRDDSARIRRLDDGAEVVPLPGMGAGTPAGLYFSPDGRFLLQSSREGRLRLWDLGGAGQRLVREDENCVAGRTAFRPDGRQLAVGHLDGSIRVYDTASGDERHRLAAGPVPECLAFHPRGRRMAVAYGREVRVVDLDRGTAAATLVCPAPIWSCGWHPDGERLALACQDGRVHLCRPGRDSGRLTLEGHRDGGVLVDFIPSGRLLVSQDWGGVVCLWDAGSGQELLRAGTGFHSRCAAGQPVLAQMAAHRLRLHRIVSSRVLRTLRSPHAPQDDGNLWWARLDSSGRWLVAGGSTTALFDLAADGRPSPAPGPWAAHNPIRVDASGALWTSAQEGLVRWPVADADSGDRHFGPPQVMVRFINANRNGVASTPDLRTFVVAAYDRGAAVIHRDRPALMLGPQSDVRNCALSPDGRLAVTGSHWSFGAHAGVKVWDTATGRLVQTLPLPCGWHLAFSPNGCRLAVREEDAAIHLWQVDSWRPGPTVEGETFAFSPDSRLLAVGGRGAIRLIDPDTGAEHARLEAPGEPVQVPQCFTPDGAQLIACGKETGLLHVWDLRALREELAQRGMDWDMPPYPPATGRERQTTEHTEHTEK